MRCFGVDVYRLICCVLLALGIVVGESATTGNAAPPPAAMVEGKPTVAENRPVVESKPIPESKGMFAEAAKLVSVNDWLGEAFWKVIGALVVLVALALLVVRLGRRLRPQWRGGGPIFIEDGRNLAPGVGVRLLRVGSRYWLIGVTRERVTLIGELSEEDLLDEPAEEEEEEPAVEIVSAKGMRHGRVVRHANEPSLMDQGLRR
ncbi:flagellar biosynthetic protein FliO [Candidatus Magnetaquicoccus inordinatus]|uniref:flagellar biosynthetic protein FliO n=1 Tax=Candidatus Magnetaquicoccus inordinatus TaxID=2496818 RepID=UPI00102D1056|nr:flagellar biosynthetic protein FliO [Candidatus Magnetaquicoccus inordinatus]